MQQSVEYILWGVFVGRFFFLLVFFLLVFFLLVFFLLLFFLLVFGGFSLSSSNSLPSSSSLSSTSFLSAGLYPLFCTVSNKIGSQVDGASPQFAPGPSNNDLTFVNERYILSPAFRGVNCCKCIYRRA